MHRLRALGTALLVVFAFSVIVATAQAEGPFYSKCSGKSEVKEGKTICLGTYERLGAGATAPFTSAGGPFSLATASAQVITCTTQKTEKGELKGSAVGTAGSASQVIVFEGCTVTGNGEGCKVAGGKITTEKVIATLAKQNQKETAGELLFVSFRPEKGNVFVKIKFEPAAKCTFAETAVELKGGTKLGVAGFADLERACTATEEKEVKEKEEAKKETLQLCKENHAPLKLLQNEELGKKGLIWFPESKQGTVWVEEGKAVTENKEGLVAFGVAATKFTGHTNIELTGVSDWGVFGK